MRAGQRVGVWLPSRIESVIALLACSKSGTVCCPSLHRDHTVGEVAELMQRTRATAFIWQEGYGADADKRDFLEALKTADTVQQIYRLKPLSETNSTLFPGLAAHGPAVPVKSDPNQVVYLAFTSGTTGKPKGIQHSSGGYLLGAMMTARWVFDLQAGDVFWCTADVGWITGHSYIVYGPLANGATTLMFEGVPNYPDAGRFWQVVDKHKVEIFYTAPTALRALMRDGDAPEPGTEVTAGQKSLGATGSAAGNRGLATLRLDRLADALAVGEPLRAGGGALAGNHYAFAACQTIVLDYELRPEII